MYHVGVCGGQQLQAFRLLLLWTCYDWGLLARNGARFARCVCYFLSPWWTMITTDSAGIGMNICTDLYQHTSQYNLDMMLVQIYCGMVSRQDASRGTMELQTGTRKSSRPFCGNIWASMFSAYAWVQSQHVTALVFSLVPWTWGVCGLYIAIWRIGSYADATWRDSVQVVLVAPART